MESPEYFIIIFTIIMTLYISSVYIHLYHAYRILCGFVDSILIQCFDVIKHGTFAVLFGNVKVAETLSYIWRRTMALHIVYSMVETSKQVTGSSSNTTPLSNPISIICTKYHMLTWHTLNMFKIHFCPCVIVYA